MLFVVVAVAILSLLLLAVPAAGLGTALSTSQLQINVGQVVPDWTCSNHWRGAQLAAELINGLNGGRGFAVGYGKSHFVRINYAPRFIAKYDVWDNATDSENRTLSDALHRQYATQLAATSDFWVGSCSFRSELERDEVNAAQTILLAQVGPNKYYEDAEAANQQYIFGMHLSSYKYTEPTLKTTALLGAKTVAIAGRDASLFFQTTCAEAEVMAGQRNMTLVMPRVEYAHPAQSENATYQRELAAAIAAADPDVVIGCIHQTLEAPIWLEVWKGLNWAPKAAWFTCTTWGTWATDTLGLAGGDAAYLLGAGQWHPKMSEPPTPGYTDSIVGDASNFTSLYQARFGGDTNDYNAVAAYTIVYMFMRVVQKTFREDDITSLATQVVSGPYEAVRRSMELVIERDTLYGPVEFDDRYQRNVGRSPAGNQYLPTSAWVAANGGVTAAKHGVSPTVDDTCVAPSDVSNGLLKYPVPGREACPVGMIHQPTLPTCWLCDKCTPCSDASHYTVSACDPATMKRRVAFQWTNAALPQCSPSSTLPADRDIECDQQIMGSSLATAFIIVAGAGCLFLFLLALFFVYKWKSIKWQQPQFIMFICFGAILGMCSVIVKPLEPSEATCPLAPSFLVLGFSICYAATCVRIYRVWRIFDNPRVKKVTATLQWALRRFALLVLMEVVILVLWLAIDRPRPVESTTELSEEMRDFGDIPHVTCSSSTTVFPTVEIVVNGFLAIVGCYLAYQTRNVPGGFRESLWVLIGMLCLCFIGIICMPLAFILTDIQVQFAVYSIATIVIPVVSVGVLLVPKIHMINAGVTAQSTMQTHTSNTMNNTTSSSSSDDRFQYENPRSAGSMTKISKTSSETIGDGGGSDGGDGDSGKSKSAAVVPAGEGGKQGDEDATSGV